jgi:ribonuclease R
MAAERETVDRLIAHFLADRIGVVFSGRVAGVTRSGLFVKLDDTGADGFVPAGTLGDQYFRYNERSHALVGDTSGETYRLGDAVTVRLVEAAPVAGALRFEMLSEGRRDATARILKKGHRPSSSRRSRRKEGASGGDVSHKRRRRR